MSYLIEERVDFIIFASHQVLCVADTYNIASGCVPNLSNYGNVFINFVCCDILEKKGSILFIFGTIIDHNMG